MFDLAAMKTVEDHLALCPISTEEETSSLARDLAEEYVQFFDVNIEHEQERYQDSIEECLAHLEEVISVLDSYKQNSQAIEGFVEVVNRGRGYLDKLYTRVDAMEQYIFETNRLLDQLDIFLNDLERHQKIRGSKLQQIIGMLPGVSSIPRIGIFSTLSSFMEDNTPNFVENETSQDDAQLVPIEEILDKLHQVASSVSNMTRGLDKRLGGDVSTSVQAHSSFIESPMANLNLGSNIESVDGSWQELL